MEALSEKSKSLKATFIWMVFITVVLVALLSIAIIWGGAILRTSLVPKDDEISLIVRTTTAAGEVTEEKILMRSDGNPSGRLIPEGAEEYTEYIVEPIYSPIRLTTKRQMLYNVLPFIMVVGPLVLALIGIVICALLFYKRKLNEPLNLLMAGSEKISNNDLDFSISYSGTDEMGVLCNSFEKMRRTLLESQKAVWNMMEERQQLNNSVAHDLRTPITIIQGYTEYLQMNIPKGKIDENKLIEVLSNLYESAHRLEQYVDSIRDVQSLDEIELNKNMVPLKSTIEEMIFDLEILANAANKELQVYLDLLDVMVNLDKQALYRILENLLSNSFRFATEIVIIKFVLNGDFLEIHICDDGDGFSQDDLAKLGTAFYQKSDSEGHKGLGLVICNILSKKHGGEISFKNSVDGGAMVDVRLLVK